MSTYGVYESSPFTSNKLYITHQLSSAVLTSKRNEPLNEFYSLYRVNATKFVHYLKDYFEGQTFVYYAESEDVDLSVIELPVCPNYGQRFNPFTFIMSLFMK